MQTSLSKYVILLTLLGVLLLGDKCELHVSLWFFFFWQHVDPLTCGNMVNLQLVWNSGRDPEVLHLLSLH